MVFTKFPRGREKPYTVTGRISAEKHGKYLELRGNLKNQDVVEYWVDQLINGKIDLASLRPRNVASGGKGKHHLKEDDMDIQPTTDVDDRIEKICDRKV